MYHEPEGGSRLMDLIRVMNGNIVKVPDYNYLLYILLPLYIPRRYYLSCKTVNNFPPLSLVTSPMLRCPPIGYITSPAWYVNMTYSDYK